jgi:hypothetical protein
VFGVVIKMYLIIIVVFVVIIVMISIIIMAAVVIFVGNVMMFYFYHHHCNSSESVPPVLQAGSMCILKQVNAHNCCSYAAGANGIVVVRATSCSNYR